MTISIVQLEIAGHAWNWTHQAKLATSNPPRQQKVGVIFTAEYEPRATIFARVGTEV